VSFNALDDDALDDEMPTIDPMDDEMRCSEDWLF
jgi:hypothetical protein